MKEPSVNNNIILHFTTKYMIYSISQNDRKHHTNRNKVMHSEGNSVILKNNNRSLLRVFSSRYLDMIHLDQDLILDFRTSVNFHVGSYEIFSKIFSGNIVRNYISYELTSSAEEFPELFRFDA